MSNETKLDIISETPGSPISPKLGRSLDRDALAMVFGTPNAPKVEPAVHANHDKDHRLPHVNTATTETEGAPASQPLLESEREHQKPPIAGSEVDDLDDTPPALAPYPGIDDGLFEPIDKKTDDDGDGSEHGSRELRFDGAEGDDGKWKWPAGPDETDYPYDGVNGFGGTIDTRFGELPISPVPGQSIPDVNTYQQKKNLAQGMMDLALLSANANQLRYVLESSSTHPYFYPSLAFISISIILQIAVGVGLIMNSRYDVNDNKERCKADKINNMTVLGVFLVTIVNVFITSFSVATPTTPVVAVTNGGG